MLDGTDKIPHPTSDQSEGNMEVIEGGVADICS